MRILAVTGSRADWGYLSPVLKLLRNSQKFDVRLAVTGQHLEDSNGTSVASIAECGFTSDFDIPLQQNGDTEVATSHGFARCVAGCSEAIASLQPDMMLLLGDRYETLAAATAAMLARVPIAHLCGGDVSEGAIDDAIRHAISKLSHLHFPTNAAAAQRLHLMGENPAHVHMVGSTGLDRLLATPRMEKEAFFSRIKFTPRQQNLVVTIHPTTLAADPIADARGLLVALTMFGPKLGVLFTGTNIDPGYRSIVELIEAFVAKSDNAILCPSLGTELYVNAMVHCDAVVGNSSSGLYEAPSLGLPTVNIGARQDGRLKAGSVIDCSAEPYAIHGAIAEALKRGRRQVKNPYGDGQASRRIVEVMSTINDPAALLRKSFHGVQS